MEQNGRWEELFSALNDDDPKSPTTPPADSTDDEASAPTAPVATPADGPGSESATPAGPTASTGAFDPSELYDALQQDIADGTAAAPAADPATSAERADVALEDVPGSPEHTGAVSRRALREQREAAATAGIPQQGIPSFPPAAASAPPESVEPELGAAPPAVDSPVVETPASPPAAEAPVASPEPAMEAVPVPEPAPWDPAPELQAEAAPTIPVSYDEVQESGVVAGGSSGGGDGRGGGRGGFPMRLEEPPSARRRRSLRWLAWCIPLVVVVGLIAYPVVYVAVNRDVPGWQLFGVKVPTSVENKVREIFGISIPIDYVGDGNGETVTVTIHQGDDGAAIAKELNQAGVTMTFAAFYDLAISLAHSTDCATPDATNGCWPTIQFGNYTLQQEMSAQSALDALQDPANKITNNLVIPEGSRIDQVLNIISATTGISEEDLDAAVADPSVYGVENPAKSLEGYLFPDTYQLDGTETAQSIIQRLVDETIAKAASYGAIPSGATKAADLTADDRTALHAFLTGASIVQKEAGPVAGDAAKVARVFQNRLEQKMKLQSDATVAYGAKNFSSIWNTTAQLNDASNLYNTYVHAGLPIGPIAAPGAVAMDAWANPADGDWLYFVPVNLKTGETHFSTTADEHYYYVEVLRDWCNASEENAAYCK